jgi:hypothetical protein
MERHIKIKDNDLNLFNTLFYNQLDVSIILSEKYSSPYNSVCSEDSRLYAAWSENEICLVLIPRKVKLCTFKGMKSINAVEKPFQDISDI